jgi:hypothetical protein
MSEIAFKLVLRSKRCVCFLSDPPQLIQRKKNIKYTNETGEPNALAAELWASTPNCWNLASVTNKATFVFLNSAIMDLLLQAKLQPSLKRYAGQGVQGVHKIHSNASLLSSFVYEYCDP